MQCAAARRGGFFFVAVVIIIIAASVFLLDLISTKTVLLTIRYVFPQIIQ